MTTSKPPRTNLKETDWAWLAGILEGEGCFALNSSYSARHRKSAGAGINMTDEDIVRRVYDLFGGNFRGPHIPKQPNRKPVWFWGCTHKPHLEFILTKIRPYMGSRRTARIDEILAYYAERDRQKAFIEHGTRRGYDKGCKCSLCKEANTNRAKDRRQKHAMVKPTPPEIGCIVCKRISSVESFRVHYGVMHK